MEIAFVVANSTKIVANSAKKIKANSPF